MPQPQSPTPPPYSTNSQFINRRQELEQIRQMLERVKRGTNLTFEGIDYYGIPGIGKSRLLQYILEQCRQQQIPAALIDFENLAALSKGEYLATLLSQFVQSSTGKTSTASAGSAKRVSDEKKLLQAFVRKMKRKFKGQPFVVIHDSCENCQPALFDWIGRDFLETMHRTYGKPLAFFLAGRGPRVSMSNWSSAYSRKVHSHYLPEFTLSDTQEHIAALDPDGRLRDRGNDLFELCKGHPYSTEALLYYLQQFNIPVRDLPKHRATLAQQLYHEVIRRKLLPEEKVWPHDSFVLACFPRRFDAGLLAVLDDSQHLNWYMRRMHDCQAISVNLVRMNSGNPAYYVDSLLRRLLHTAYSILHPEKAIALHRHLQEIHEQKLAVEASQGRQDVFSIVELLYHHIQGQILTFQAPMPATADLLQNKLETHFNRFRSDQGLQMQLAVLRDMLEQDGELHSLLRPAEIHALQATIDAFIQQPDKAKSCMISIQHNPPAEYHAYWAHSHDRPLVPAERVRTHLKFSLDDWQKAPEKTGNTAFKAYLPAELQTFLRQQKEYAIRLKTNTMDIPFELLHDGDEFLCLAHAMGRQVEMLRKPKDVLPIPGDVVRALVIGNPTGDLPNAAKEAEWVTRLLKEAGAKVDQLIGEQEATLRAIVEHLGSQQYHLVHYAGHAYFDDKAPSLSGLLCCQNDKSIVPFYAEEFKRHLDYPAFFFFNACEAASAAPETTTRDSQGVLIENLALGVLEAGATGCLAPMWKIPDKNARDFAYAFYTHLLDGDSIGEAVRKSRMELRTSAQAGKQDSANLWASWILFGNPHGHPFRG